MADKIISTVNDTLSQQNYGNSRSQNYPQVFLPAEVVPQSHLDRREVQTCSVDIGHGAVLKAWAFGEYIVVGPPDTLFSRVVTEVPVAPFITAKAVGQSYNKDIQIKTYDRNQYGYHYNSRQDKLVTVTDSYYADHRGGYFRYEHDKNRVLVPWNYLKVEVTTNNGTTEIIETKFLRPNEGEVDLTLVEVADQLPVTKDFFGRKLQWFIEMNEGHKDDYYSTSPFHTMWNLAKNYTVKQGTEALWSHYFSKFGVAVPDAKGISAAKSQKGTKELLARLEAENPSLFQFFNYLHDSKSRAGVSNNTLLSAFLRYVGTDYEMLVSGLRKAMREGLSKEPCIYGYNHTDDTRPFAMALPGAKDKDDERRSKKEWNLRKSCKEQAEGLGINPAKYPLLSAAVENQHIPLSIFHEPGKPTEPVNTEFGLWEKALAREGWAETLYAIAQDASRRTTYEKNVTPYISFLFRIEKYLERNAPPATAAQAAKPWKSMPKFVASQWDLEMDEPSKEGTVKRRSALTPEADNEKRIITVPYASIAIHGRQTTYCYSLNYYVFEEHTLDAESETPIVNELEEKLNGRDDYRLMYYTLTGTARNQGYPTFLIIFERLRSGETRVHFHRVHPCRTKDGIKTPASQLVEECYRYMAGNVRAEEICAQQGDLLFIR